jgi:hypothetical protein
MEDRWPSGAGLWGQAPNRPVLRWLKTVVVSDRGKASFRRQVGTRKMHQSARTARLGVAVEASSNVTNGAKTEGKHPSSGRAWREPADWPGGARRIGGMSLVCGSCTEREKASVDTAGRSNGPLAPRPARGDVPRQQPKALSTVAPLAGGPARSSWEAPARWGGGGAKGPAHQSGHFVQLGPAQEEARRT